MYLKLNFWHKDDGEKWSRKSYLEIEVKNFAQNYKFSNKNYLLFTWRDFIKKIVMIN